MGETKLKKDHGPAHEAATQYTIGVSYIHLHARTAMVKNIRSANNVRLTGHHAADPIGSSVTLIFMCEAGQKLKNSFAY